MPSARDPCVELTRFVLRVLQEIDPAATLRDFHPSGERQYALSVSVPGEVGNELRLPRRLVERAARNRWAQVMLRRILRSAVLVLRSQRSLSDTRAGLAAIAPDPLCPVCLRRVPAEEPLFVYQGQVVHARCYVHQAVPPRRIK